MLLLPSTLYAQQVVHPISNFTRQAFNPAITGSNAPLSFQAAVCTSTPLRTAILQADGFISRYSLALGALSETHESFLETQNSFRFNLAYRVKARKGFWQLGLSPILHNHSLHTNNLNIRNEGDGLTPSASQQWALNFNVGILYKSPKLFFSLYAQNISNSLDPIASHYSYLLGYSSYSGLAGYSFALSKKLRYTPLIYVHHIKKHGTYIATSHQLSHEYFFAGLQYGWPSTLMANIGLHYQPSPSAYKITLGYAFGQQLSGLQNTISHHLFLSIDFSAFGLPQKPLKDLPHYRSPIYF